jgi:hypothetical protein
MLNGGYLIRKESIEYFNHRKMGQRTTRAFINNGSFAQISIRETLLNEGALSTATCAQNQENYIPVMLGRP